MRLKYEALVLNSHIYQCQQRKTKGRI